MTKRMGWVTRISADRLDEYRELHADPWCEITDLLTQANITNYSIWLYEPELLLFSSFEYSGTDFERDMATLGLDPTAKKWHKLTSQCQIEMGGPDVPWASLIEVFRLD